MTSKRESLVSVRLAVGRATWMMSVSKRVILVLISSIGLSRLVVGETNYFLVGPHPALIDQLHDSYVLPLSKQQDIDYARYLISRYPLGFLEGDRTFVGAWIAAGSQGISRNYLDPKLTEWSWHVAEFIVFAEGVEEVLDGSPTLLENRFDWAHFGTGQWEIGFVAYTVVRELGPVPLYLSIIPEEESLQFYWSGVGTNYVYTLEGKESLASTNWLALPGASWPLRTNHWTLPLTNAPAPLYRVKAEQANL